MDPPPTPLCNGDRLARPPAVALVGKGLVYDTGGLNLKTSGGRSRGLRGYFSFEDSCSFGIAIGEFSMQSSAACRKVTPRPRGQAGAG